MIATADPESGELRLLQPALPGMEGPLTVSLLTERRESRPYGLLGGEPGEAGRNRLRRAHGEEVALPARATLRVDADDLLIIETPGGGGFGSSRLSEGELACRASDA